MLTNAQIVTAVLAWVEATVPAVAGRTYDYPPGGKPKGLPDVVCTVEDEGLELDDPMFRWQIQQAGTYRWDVELSFMADAGVDDAGESAAHNALRGYVEALKASLFADDTLGGRVPQASPWTFTADYTRPFVEYEDGTRGRHASVTFAVAEPITVAD